MHIFWFISFFALSFFSIYLHTHYALVKDLTELGEKTCSDLDDLRLNIDNIWHFISNLINTRNVYYGKYKNRNVYIKQLSQNPEFEDYIVCCVSNFYCRNGTSQHQQIMVFDEFHICSWNTSTRFFKQFITLEDLEEWTGSALINPEPLLLKYLGPHFPYVPKLLGWCGRLIIEEDAGERLATAALRASFLQRVCIARKLLQAAQQFTNPENHTDFRFYLTDVSYDNVVVNKEFTEVIFIDLDSVILRDKTNKDGLVHVSPYFEDEPNLIYSVSDICESSVSDHNIYAICKVFLAPNNGSSPLNEGLLFSPPAKYEKLMWKYNKIVKDCVTGQSGDRNLAKTILFDVLDDIEKY